MENPKKSPSPIEKVHLVQHFIMQHNWSITGFLLLLWLILLPIAILLNLRTAVLLMPIVLIILLLYLSMCLFFAFYHSQSTQKTVKPSSPKLLSHLLKKEHEDDESFK